MNERPRKVFEQSLLIDNVLIDNSETIANKFNDLFVSFVQHFETVSKSGHSH